MLTCLSRRVDYRSRVSLGKSTCVIDGFFSPGTQVNYFLQGDLTYKGRKRRFEILRSWPESRTFSIPELYQ